MEKELPIPLGYTNIYHPPAQTIIINFRSKKIQFPQHRSTLIVFGAPFRLAPRANFPHLPSRAVAFMNYPTYDILLCENNVLIELRQRKSDLIAAKRFIYNDMWHCAISEMDSATYDSALYFRNVSLTQSYRTQFNYSPHAEKKPRAILIDA